MDFKTFSIESSELTKVFASHCQGKTNFGEWRLNQGPYACLAKLVYLEKPKTQLSKNLQHCLH